MGRIKEQLKQVRQVRKCWTEPPHEMSTDDCKRIGCPYAGMECLEMGFMDAMYLLERLYKKLKKAKKGTANDQH